MKNNLRFLILETLLNKILKEEEKSALSEILFTHEQENTDDSDQLILLLEKKYWKKVEMFNEAGEIPLFERLGFNAVFYAEVIAGDRMPNLAYMTSFENMEERNRHWKTFTEDAEWKNLVGMEKYQHNVSKADILLLKAAAYSDY